MANSFVRYTGNGSNRAYAINFSYRSTDDLSTLVAGSAVTAYVLDSAGTTLTFDVAPANGAAIEIRRTTSQTAKLVDYVSGAVLTENDLDTDSDQAFYMSQEAIDKAGDVIVLDPADFQWDGQSKRLKNIATPVDNTDAVNKAYISTNIPNITTVAGISANVTAVAGNATNINAVAADATDIGLVATNIGSVNTVAADITKVIAVANDLAEAVSEVETVANDLNEATSEIDTVATSITNVDTVGTNIANVNTVAGISANVTTVAGVNANVTTVAGISSDVTAVAGISTDVSAVENIKANVTTVAGVASDVTTVAGISADVAAVENIAANVTTVAGISANVTSVAGISSEISAVNANATNINTVAAANTNVNNVGGAITNINTVATNLASVNNFAEQYRISSSAPTTSLTIGDLYFDTTANELKVYKSSGWAAAGSTVNGTSARYNYTATAGQTTFTGLDTLGNTLAYDAGFADVYLNGVRLSASDITITSGTSVVLATGATVGDVLDIVAYGTFNVAAVDGTAINSGTINDARLPTTMAGKTLTTATVTGTINAETLIAKGDSSSADGKITLNCSQNTHGVKIQSPAHSSAQDYTLVLPTSVGTNGQVLATNGNATNQLSWVNAVETKPTISSGNIYIAPSTGVTFTLAGANFASIPIVEFITSAGAITRATAVAFTNSGSLNVTTNLANGAYKVRVENPDGNAGVSSGQIINASSAPTWSTGQTLGAFAGNATGTLVTLSASSDSTVSYAEVGSNLTTGNMTLSGANITTTDFGGSSTSPTQYTFTIRATDAEGQYLDRQFTINSSFGATGSGGFN